jgi:hypothetical protein
MLAAGFAELDSGKLGFKTNQGYQDSFAVGLRHNPYMLPGYCS